MIEREKFTFFIYKDPSIYAANFLYYCVMHFTQTKTCMNEYQQQEKKRMKKRAVDMVTNHIHMLIGTCGCWLFFFFTCLLLGLFIFGVEVVFFLMFSNITKTTLKWSMIYEIMFTLKCYIFSIDKKEKDFLNLMILNLAPFDLNGTWKHGILRPI